MPQVSIVVPVYKVEKYLQRCVDSIMQQTLKDIEIILVDDGSPDSCPEMCDKFALEDDRIKVVHKTNGGLSSARNAGMKVATGKYIGFVDSDDSVVPEMYKIMYETIERENVDFVMSDYLRISAQGKSFLKTLDIEAGRYGKEKLVSVIFPQLIMGKNIDYGPLLSVWHCLYNLEFLRKNQLVFDEEVRWSEDNIFSAQVGYLANGFFYLKGKGLYCYYENAGSITTSYRKGAWQVYKTMNEHLHRFFDNVLDYDFSTQLKTHMMYYACNCLGQVSCSGKSMGEQITMVREIMNDDVLCECFHSYKFSKNWSVKMRIQMALIKCRCALLYRMLVLR